MLRKHLLQKCLTLTQLLKNKWPVSTCFLPDKFSSKKLHKCICILTSVRDFFSLMPLWDSRALDFSRTLFNQDPFEHDGQAHKKLNIYNV